MAAILIAVVAAAAGSAATAIVAGAVGAIVAGAVAYGATLLFNTPKKTATKSGASSASDRKLMIRTPVSPRVIVYGQARVSGSLVYAASSGEAQIYLHLVVVLAGHPIHAIDTVLLNDVPVYISEVDGSGMVIAGQFAGHVRIHKYLGNQTTADADLIAESPDGWSAEHKLLGCAYLYVRLEYTRDLFSSGIPTISAEVWGRNDILDVRNGLTGYSNNPALCILNYMRSEAGLAAAADELDAGTFIAAANLCDEAVDLTEDGSQTQRRYELDGVFTTDVAPIQVVEDMLTSCAGTMTYVQGQHRLYAGGYEAPTGSLGISDMAGSIELETLPTRSDLFNSVRGTFVNPAQAWQQSEFPAWTNAGLQALDGEVIWRDVEFPFTIDGVRAQRLAKMLLDRARESLTIRCPVRYAGLRYVVWQMLSVTLPDFGFAAKPFRVVSWTFDPQTGVVNLTLREESAASYAWLYDDPSEYPEAPDTTLIDPLTIPVPQDLVLIATTALNADGAAMPALELTWTASPHAFVTATEVQWRVSAGPGAWSSAEVPAGTTRYIIAPVVVGQLLDVRVRAVAGLVRSAWSATINGLGVVDTTAPGVPTGLVAVGQTRAVALRWVNPGDRDLRHVEIWERAAPTGSPWAKVGESGSDFFLRPGFFPAEQRYFRLRAVDRSGNAGGYTAEVSGQATLLVVDDIADGIVNTAKFASGLAPVELIEDLSVVKANNTVALNMSDGRLYRRVGGAWTAEVPAVAVSGQLTNAQLAEIAAAKVTGQLTDAQIAGLAAAKLTGQITSTQITDDAITTPKLAAAAVEAENLSAGSVTTAKLAVGQGKNVIWNACCPLTTAGWTTGGNQPPDAIGRGSDIDPIWGFPGAGNAYIHRSAGLDPGGYMAAFWDNAPGYPCQPGQCFEAHALLLPHRCQGRVHLVFYDSTQAVVGEFTGGFAANPATPANAWSLTDYSQSWCIGQAPAAAFWVRFYVHAEPISGHADDPYLFWTRAYLGPANPNQTEPSDWAPGGITEIDGGVIRTDTILARHIAAGQITAEELAAGAVTAGKVAANAITANEIAANSVTAGKVASNAINTGAIAAGAVRAGQIAAGEIRAEHLASETIITQAAQMGTAVIGNAQIAELSLAGNRLAANEITTFASGTALPAQVGDGAWHEYPLFGVTLPNARNGFCSASLSQQFPGGFSDWASQLWLADGAGGLIWQMATASGGSQETAPTMASSFTIDAGYYTVRLHWRGEDSNVVLYAVSAFALLRFR